VKLLGCWHTPAGPSRPSPARGRWGSRHLPVRGSVGGRVWPVG